MTAEQRIDVYRQCDMQLEVKRAERNNAQPMFWLRAENNRRTPWILEYTLQHGWALGHEGSTSIIEVEQLIQLRDALNELFPEHLSNEG